MSKQANNDSTEAAATATTTDGNETSSENEAAATATEGDGEEQLGEAGIKALEKERERAKNAEKRAKDLERELKDLKAARAGEDDAKLTELERAGKERDKWRSDFETLEGSLKKERVNARALEAAGKLGAIEPAAVANLLSADKVEWDDELQPTNVDELIAAVKKDYPRLFSAAPGKGNGGDRPAKEVNADTSPYGRLRNAYASSR